MATIINLNNIKKLVLLLGFINFGICNSYSQTGWTIIVYISGDNSLSLAGIEDLNEMEGAMNGVSSNVIVLIDELGDHNTHAYEVEYDNNGPTNTAIVSSSITLSDINVSWGDELNLGDGQTLEDFASWSIDHYPANRYALILWDHGNGWLSYKKSTYGEDEVVKSICWDNHNNDYLRIDEVRNSIINIYNNTNNTKIDLLGMDACLMAMLEVYYQFYGYAEVGVASEELEPLDGWEYAFLSELSSNPNMTAATLSTHIVDYYSDSYSDGSGDPSDVNTYTLSAFYIGSLAALGESESIAQITNHLGNLLCSYMYDNYNDINTAQNNCSRFNNRCETCWWVTDKDDDYIDLYDFVENLNSQNINAYFNSYTQMLMDNINDAIIHEEHGNSRNFAHGISIYFEENSSQFDTNYNTISHYLEFSKYASWDEMHHTFYNNSVIEWEEEINISGDFYISSSANLTVEPGTEVYLWYLWNSSITVLDKNCTVENDVVIDIAD